MTHIPGWIETKVDPELDEAYVEADQDTGDGLANLLKQMIRIGEQTGSHAFIWQKDPDPKEDPAPKP